ncbi:MAG: EAL domain-containing protein [Ruminococcus sp.]|nr:EAL domain-containing protein [Ruminococcus sp.]
MKWIFSPILFTAAVFLMIFGFISFSKTKNKPVASPLRRVLFLSGTALTFLGAAFVAKDEMPAYLLYAVYLCLSDAVLISLTIYVKRYTGLYSRAGGDTKYFCFGALIDCIMLLADPITHWVFTLSPYYDKFGSFFYRISERHVLYWYHLVLVYVMAAAALSTLARKIVRSPKIYKMKYLCLLLTIAFILLIHAVCVRFDALADASLIFYPIAGAILLYFTVLYIPRGLMERLLFFTIANMKDGIICLDVDGKPVHANRNAHIFCSSENDPKAMEIQIERWFRENITTGTNNQSWSLTRRVDDINRYYDIEYKTIFDAQYKYLGCFFIIHDKTEEYAGISAEKYRANHDLLTGLYNKERFNEAAGTEILGNTDVTYYIVCTDVKNFKIVNDVFGTETGDRLLKRLAEIYGNFCTEDYIYGRLTGDRFAMCVRKDRFDGKALLDAISEITDFTGNNAFKIYVHIGVYEVTDPYLKISVMCDRANLAIKTVKDSYSNIIAYYDSKLREGYLNEQKVISLFEEALSKRQFCFFIQPQTQVNGRVLGGEALVRWIHPTDGMISPGSFVPVFEQAGLISRLDKYIWELACAQLRKWDQEGFGQNYLSVNISQKDFYVLDIYKIFTGLVKKYQINPKNLHLEITETAIMNDPRSQLPLIDKLRQFGFLVEIDDFGSGYSSLNTLKDFNADVLKIDMGFLSTKAENEAKSKTILRSVISLAKALNMEVITEGVETQEQVQFLTEFGCDVFQGYYFAKPMPAAEFEKTYLF